MSDAVLVSLAAALAVGATCPVVAFAIAAWLGGKRADALEERLAAVADLHQDRLSAAERRAADAERQRDALLSASQRYLAGLPVGGHLSDDDLRVLLDATAAAAGAAVPPAAGVDGAGHGVDPVG